MKLFLTLFCSFFLIFFDFYVRLNYEKFDNFELWFDMVLVTFFILKLTTKTLYIEIGLDEINYENFNLKLCYW